MLPFNRLQKHGSLQFPDASVKLLQFSTPANIPHIKLPTAFVSAAISREVPFGVNGMVESDKIIEVVNVVMDNMEDYLPNVMRHDTEER